MVSRSDLDQDYPTEVAVSWKLDLGLGLYELYIYNLYIYVYIYVYGGFLKLGGGTPIAGWYIIEDSIKMDEKWGYPHGLETSMYYIYVVKLHSSLNSLLGGM